MDFPCRFVGGEKKHTYRDFLAGTVNGEERRDGLLHEAVVAQEVIDENCSDNLGGGYFHCQSPKFTRDRHPQSNKLLGGGVKYFFIFTPNPGEMVQFDEHIFQMG